MNIPNPSPLLKSFYTITEKLERLEKDFQEVKQEASELRTNCATLSKEVAVLRATIEQNEKLFEARMRSVVSETIADLRIRYAEQQSSPNTIPLPPASGDSSGS